MKKGRSTEMTAAQTAELEALAVLPESRINTAVLPEQTDWNGGRRGMFFRPVKKQLTLRLDADLIAWFKGHARAGEGYQTGINRALRHFVALQGNADEPSV